MRRETRGERREARDERLPVEPLQCNGWRARRAVARRAVAVQWLYEQPRTARRVRGQV